MSRAAGQNNALVAKDVNLEKGALVSPQNAVVARNAQAKIMNLVALKTNSVVIKNRSLAAVQTNALVVRVVNLEKVALARKMKDVTAAKNVVVNLVVPRKVVALIKTKVVAALISVAAAWVVRAVRGVLARKMKAAIAVKNAKVLKAKVAAETKMKIVVVPINAFAVKDVSPGKVARAVRVIANAAKSVLVNLNKLHSETQFPFNSTTSTP
eukprot:NODE_537_length_6324_cov_1.677430.p5 type:complete len:211 gc:universal NODE_537_length_6324_cov_1.677430:2561-1929(-)